MQKLLNQRTKDAVPHDEKFDTSHLCLQFYFTSINQGIKVNNIYYTKLTLMKYLSEKITYRPTP